MSEMLNGMKEIRARFKVSMETVREWAAQGAPIIVHHVHPRGKRKLPGAKARANGYRYSADYEDLCRWLINKTREAQKKRQGFWG